MMQTQEQTQAPPAQKSILSLTDAAIERIRTLIDKADDPVIGLRVSISSKGCSGHGYVVEYAHDKKQFEEEITANGITLLIDPAAVMFLIGSTIDYQEDKMQSGFTFINPNEKGRCGCGESFSV
ncbi:MAG: HesB/IscA family protein [Alphaproteobacteria bacterium]